MSGYALERVLRFCQEQGHVRECDGRVMRLNNRPMPESLRNTLANWRAKNLVAELGRWDEILMAVDLMLWEYEAWECATYGDLSFHEEPATMNEAASNTPNQEPSHGT